MNKLLFLILVIIVPGVILILATYLAYLNVDWQKHKSMTIENCDRYGKGTYYHFLREFSTYENWIVDKDFPDSMFGQGNDAESYCIHEGIIQFNGKGMILGFWSYLRFKKFMKTMEYINLRLLDKCSNKITW